MTRIETKDLPAHPAWKLGNVVDVRTARDFEAGHAARAVSMPLLVDEGLDESLPAFRLPPRHEPLLIVAGEVLTAMSIAAWLRERGRPDVTACAMGVADVAALPAADRATGPSTGRLWKPPSFLETALPLLPAPAAGPVVDFGAGSGRAAVWLAGHGYEVTAIDRHAEALAMGRSLAADSGVECAWLKADLRRDDEAAWAGPWSVAIAFRYLERPLLASLPRLMRPGGVAVVNTFRTAPGFDGPPAERHRLAPGELLRIFTPDRWKVLTHVEEYDPDGRPDAGIVARLMD